MKDFKEAYKFPLKKDEGYGKVFTVDNNMAFDFAPKWLYDDAITLSDQRRQDVVDVINGTRRPSKNDYKLEYNSENGMIRLDNKSFILIRGWGYLTGSGGLKLPWKTAKKLQDDFAQYIIDQLTFKTK